MSAPKLSNILAQQAVDAVAQFGSSGKAAEVLRVPAETVRARRREGAARGLKPSGNRIISPEDSLKRQVTRLESDLRSATQKSIDEESIRRHIIKLADSATRLETPEWVIEPAGRASSPGVPTLFFSDLHWGEVVQPSQINGVNQYNLKIAKTRLHNCFGSAVKLLRIISPKMDYPGLVMPLGGDLVSGNIHDELTATNELNTMPTVLDLYGELVALITAAADTFGRVFVPAVSGNHGRDTHKIWSKDRHATSFDWLLCCLLAKRFEGDKRVTFHIPDGPDAYYRIYNHRYLLTHGDQFRGGDGLIGALGPIVRGDHKKRSRNAQIDMEYDTMICGHWHQYVHLTRLIVNGSLKGLDEYAYSNNFPFEQPQQALWLTHQKYGITYRMPVLVERQRPAAKTSWVAIAA
ncbi:MAG: hypothetical protein Q8R92_05980 [Deltaproteobacteria bacterium]|nr:hypothetical protein [Deltaproteobacteria bacterium]